MGKLCPSRQGKVDAAHVTPTMRAEASCAALSRPLLILSIACSTETRSCFVSCVLSMARSSRSSALSVLEVPCVE